MYSLSFLIRHPSCKKRCFYGSKNDWLVSISFTLMISLAVFMILDLDKPRTGIITSKDANLHIIAIKDMFK